MSRLGNKPGSKSKGTVDRQNRRKDEPVKDATNPDPIVSVKPTKVLKKTTKAVKKTTKSKKKGK